MTSNPITPLATPVWNSYVNEDYNFAFDYPEEVTVEAPSPGPFQVLVYSVSENPYTSVQPATSYPVISPASWTHPRMADIHLVYTGGKPMNCQRVTVMARELSLSSSSSVPPRIKVTGERVQEAARRLSEERLTDAQVLLNFAAATNRRVLVLGAWGCGVFRNDPVAVCRAFMDALQAPPFVG